ncbi:GAF domain-containing protein [Streptomyces platensis]|uniref:GAF domain-containing protein n=1 Tax=Streptomyces platensis TaxID=58346 RepID=UPI0037B3C9D2
MDRQTASPGAAAQKRELPRIARGPHAATLLAQAGIHSCPAVPLIARGQVLGALVLVRGPLPSGEDDTALAGCATTVIDNARWLQSVRCRREVWTAGRVSDA